MKEKDALISHFIENEEIINEIKEILTDIKPTTDLYDGINKQLSHLTFSRGKIEFFNHTKNIYENISEAFEIFEREAAK